MSKKRFFNKLVKNKQRIAISGITVLVGVGVIVGSYFIFNRSEDSVDEGVKDEFNIDYIKYVSGIKNWIVQVGVDNDYLEGIRWETYAIKDVTVDVSGVSKDKEGKYNLVYKIDIKDPKEKDLEKTVTVEVVSAHKAKELASKGKDVVLAVADETKPEEKEEDKQEENEEEKKNDDIEGKEDNSSNEETASKEDNVSPPNDTSNNPSKGEGSSHSHSWKPITNIVYHDEIGHWEEVVIEEPWVEEKPIYEEREILICNDCGADLTYLSDNDLDNHINNHRANGGSGSLRAEWERVQVGIERIDYPAVTEKKWIIDKAPWKETITTGHKCSCGATK